MRSLLALLLVSCLSICGFALADVAGTVATIYIAVTIEPDFPADSSSASRTSCDANLYYTEISGAEGTSYESGCDPFIANILLSDSGAQSVTLLVAPI